MDEFLQDDFSAFVMDDTVVSSEYSDYAHNLVYHGVFTGFLVIGCALVLSIGCASVLKILRNSN